MSAEQSPEDGWPTIPVLAPYQTPEAPEFETFLVDAQDEALVDEALRFYETNLIPQLVCAVDGSAPALPSKGWIMSQHPPRSLVIAKANGEMRGVWVVKEGQLYYPCATIDYIAKIFRALWVETIQHFDYVWGSTKNPIILEFAKKAEHIPRNSMDATINGDRLEWRRS